MNKLKSEQSPSAFKTNDLVTLSVPWLNIPAGTEAIVVEELQGACSLFVRGFGACAWFDPGSLALKEVSRPDLLARWKAELQSRADRESDIDWIFEHSDQVLESPNGYSLQGLATSLGYGDLWGSRGEGVVYTMNAHAVLALATPYLRNKDKSGWLKFCESAKSV